jgi:glutathione S-transferase
MELVYLTILLALVEYIGMAAYVGRARVKYGIRAPATTGHPDFERVNRVHINTLESLVIFVPAVVIFGLYMNPLWAAVLGGLFVIGRALYAVGYYSAAEKRGIGAGITGIANIALVVGALIGVVQRLL